MIRRVSRLAPPAAAAVLITAVAAALLPGSAFAHATLIEREDLPLPEWLFIYGALVVVVASFVGLLLGWHKPRFEDVPSRPVATRLSALLLNPFAEAVCGAIGVALLILVVWTGLDGTGAPEDGTFNPLIALLPGSLVTAPAGDRYLARADAKRRELWHARRSANPRLEWAEGERPPMVAVSEEV